MLSTSTPNQARLHRLFRSKTRNARKRPETGRRDVDFKPIQAPFRPTAKTACNYTKRPEVKAPPAVAAQGRKRRLGRRNGADRRTRWTAAGMLEAERQFRKIIGYRDLATLVIAIERDLDRRRAPQATSKEAAIVLTA